MMEGMSWAPPCARSKLRQKRTWRKRTWRKRIWPLALLVLGAVPVACGGDPTGPAMPADAEPPRDSGPADASDIDGSQQMDAAQANDTGAFDDASADAMDDSNFSDTVVPDDATSNDVSIGEDGSVWGDGVPIGGVLARRSTNGQSVVITGWACRREQSTALPAEIYVGGTHEFVEANRGETHPLYQSNTTLVIDAGPPIESGAGVLARCGSGTTSYSFRHVLSEEESREFVGRTIYLYGVDGGTNVLLARSAHVPARESITVSAEDSLETALMSAMTRTHSVEVVLNAEEISLDCGAADIPLDPDTCRPMPGPRQHCLELLGDGAQRLVISSGRREGTTIRITGTSSAGLLNAGNLHTLSLNGLTIVHDELPFTQGRITAVSSQQMEWQVDAGHRQLPSEFLSCLNAADSPALFRNYGFAHHADGRLIAHSNLLGMEVHFESCVETVAGADVRYRCDARNGEDFSRIGWQVGDRFFMNASTAANVIRVNSVPPAATENLIFNNVVLQSGGLGIAANRVRNAIDVSGMRVEPRDDDGIAALNFGLFNLQENRGRVRLEYSQASDIYDDYFNSNSRSMPIERTQLVDHNNDGATDARAFEVLRIGRLDPRVGDTFLVLDSRTDEVIDEFEATALTEVRSCQILVDEDAEPATPPTPRTFPRCLRVESPNWSLPRLQTAEIHEYRLLNLSTAAPFSVIQTNRFGRNNARKLFLNGFGHQVFDNVFDHIGSNGVLIRANLFGTLRIARFNRSGQYLGPVATNIRIYRNTFHGGTSSSGHESPIYVGFLRPDNPAIQQGPRDIFIEDNEFCGSRYTSATGESPVQVKDVSSGMPSVVLRGNNLGACPGRMSRIAHVTTAAAIQ